ncbi:NmrA domain-containing protein [Mycena chlorophos]|uniref:NmrA domain-containing protein n=1 Tax=Mycena chlorophos TaxID=658473 RepID=A0A8H6SAY2_MYCCL|nr:NmrA domain-containing protein [Mycena chlorophos]
MRFNAALVLASVVAAVQATDFRLLYNLPPTPTRSPSPSSTFGNACATWAPALASGVPFQSFNVEAGDYQGKNKDTEALIECVFGVAGDQTAYTTDVAASLGATEAS